MRHKLIKSMAGIVVSLLLTGIMGPAFGETPPTIDHTTSARSGEKCSPCVLILFLYDLNKQWHVIRAATYNSLDACKTEGNRVNADMERTIDKTTPQATTSFYCLREETIK